MKGCGVGEYVVVIFFKRIVSEREFLKCSEKIGQVISVYFLGGFGARVGHPETHAVHEVKMDSFRGYEGEG